MQIIIQRVRGEWRLMFRQKKQFIQVCLFCLLILVLFPLSIPVGSTALTITAPAIFWLTSILGALKMTEIFMVQEYQEGVLEQWLIREVNIHVIILIKLLLYFLAVMFPMAVFSPFFSMIYHYPWSKTLELLEAIVFGLPFVISISSLASVFGLGMQQKGAVMAIIVFPLVIPIIIIGAGLPAAVEGGQPIAALLSLLLAASILGMSFVPMAIRGVLSSQL